ncbi:MAG TPA: Ohr family peroxiredoxin, partial [Solirubrobacterales bacterium]|nr:Ohr family peroxiredoxin [Solirubrobacterales bacterium]
LFAVGYAACFEGALGAVSRREKVELGDVAIDSSVSLVTTEDRGYTVAVKLDVALPDISDGEQAKEIVAAAHKVCPYSNATRGNIDVDLVANGQPVG